jgi:ferritin-like metal-binding protein YciE
VPASLDRQLAVYLTDAHAMEIQALEQVRRARKVAGDPEIEAAFDDHVRETERHQTYVADRLMALSWAPVPQKDLAGKLSGVGMALFARFQPDTPGKLVAHATSYERLEMAVYDLLGRLAARSGDRETAMMARMIGEEERGMAERLMALLDRAVDASLRDVGEDEVGKQLGKYLADAHAIEAQAAQLLEKAPQLAGAKELAAVFEEHLEQTRRHSELIKARLEERGEGRSTVKDAALRLGALNLSLLFKAQADSPAKLGACAYAFEHLEVAAYELLGRVAKRAGDDATADVASGILLEERAAAARIHDLLDAALTAWLEDARVSV